MYYRDNNGNKIDGKITKENFENKDIFKLSVNIIAPLAVGLLTFVILYPAAIELFKINLTDKTSLIIRILITLIVTGVFFYLMFAYNY